MAANPLQFNDFLYFKIRDISKSGLRVITSLRNKFIVPGMEFQTQISFPLTSQISLPLRVARVNLTAEHGKDYLEVGLEFSELSRHHREVIGQYLIQFSDAESLQAIREEGFFPTSLTKGVDYQYIKSADEFKEVLELRLLANSRNGKVPGHYSASDMADIYDTRSRIIVGRYRGKIVGTIRLAFNELGQQLEHENYVNLPPEFPRSEQILECARAATHPDFRGSDLWNTLVQHVAIAAVQAKRPWVLLSTTSELLTMYLRLGFKDTGLRYKHELYPDKEQLVMYVNLREVVVGHGVGPLYWNAVWKSVANHLAQSDTKIASTLASTRVKVYLLLAPFAQILRYFSSRPRKKKA
jgi:predicted GNAT family N-acyltransferase